MKRDEYLNWDGFFLGIAALASYRSKDPSTQNGACIVNVEKRIVSVGYNGFPDGCSDDEFPWERPEKYDYVEHAERNAIYNAARHGISLEDCIIYLYSEKGYFPCCDCARAIIQSGVREVVMGFVAEVEKEKETKDWKFGATVRMLKAAGVSIKILADKEATVFQVQKIIKDFDLIAKRSEEAAEKLVRACDNG